MGSRKGAYMVRTDDNLSLIVDESPAGDEFRARIVGVIRSEERDVRLELITADNGDTVETELVARYSEGLEVEE